MCLIFHCYGNFLNAYFPNSFFTNRIYELVKYTLKKWLRSESQLLINTSTPRGSRATIQFILQKLPVRNGNRSKWAKYRSLWCRSSRGTISCTRMYSRQWIGFFASSRLIHIRLASMLQVPHFVFNQLNAKFVHFQPVFTYVSSHPLHIRFSW